MAVEEVVGEDLDGSSDSEVSVVRRYRAKRHEVDRCFAVLL